jgi:methylated-DNA-[protein]-cysteine S-methyltransferase
MTDPSDHDVLAQLEASIPTPAPEELLALRARLAIDADEAGVLDLGYRVVDSPFGSLLVAATADGVARLAFEREDHARVLEELSVAVGPRVLRSARRTDAVARELDEYFAGHRHDFDVAIDLRLATGFRRTVLVHLREIGYGRTESYGEVARAVGNPGAVRAAGTACATNPVPLVVPCHRVVRSDGSPGNYRGGPEMKRALLAMESAR